MGARSIERGAHGQRDRRLRAHVDVVELAVRDAHWIVVALWTWKLHQRISLARKLHSARSRRTALSLESTKAAVVIIEASEILSAAACHGGDEAVYAHQRCR